MESYCKCGIAPVVRQVVRDSPNKGKWYSACVNGKKDEGGCGEFKWVQAPDGQEAAPLNVRGTQTQDLCDRLSAMKDDLESIKHQLFEIRVAVSRLSKSNNSDTLQ